MSKLISLAIVAIVMITVGCTPKSTDQNNTALADKTFDPNWESLKEYDIPEWFQDDKFGIFIHWGAYSVPAYKSEWYPRWMYMDTATFSAQLKHESDGPNEVYEYHKKKYGDQKEFGYKDFIPMFKGENFDADEWIDIFKKAGAKYVVPVAEHHDGFAMYNSNFTRWNSVDMGPKRDILKELFASGKKSNLKMGASSHFAFNWGYFNKKPHFDTMDPDYADFYSKKGTNLEEPVSEEFKTLWWNRTKDIIDNYQPDVLWFDFFFDQDAFKDYHPKLASYYYNKGLEWDKEVVLQSKNYHYESFPLGTHVHDLERGKMSKIKKTPWQTDTSIGRNSWCHVDGWDSKDANSLIDDLIDIVSKNGCLLLNVGPKADGTIPQDQQDILFEMGDWLAINGEGIYGTRYWKTFGEGPTEVKEGYFSETKEKVLFTDKDLRFTTKDGKLYVIALDWDPDGQMDVRALAKGSEYCDYDVVDVELLGHEDNLKWNQDDKALHITLPKEKPCKYAYVFSVDFGENGAALTATM